MENLVLVHHGIKGQRWGVRRFQNKDGTRTAKGKHRSKFRPVDPLGDLVVGMNKAAIKGKSGIGEVESDVKYRSKGDPIEKLNLYRDHATASKRHMDKHDVVKATGQKYYDDPLTGVFLSDRVQKKMQDVEYEYAKQKHTYASKKADEMLKQITDAGITLEEVPSYRTIYAGNSTTQWLGTKYVKKS